MMKKYCKIKLNLLVTLVILIGVVFPSNSTSFAAAPDKMEVHFIDVGQGDSTLIICGKHAMLIDAGDDSKGTAIQNYLKKQGVEKLDYLILTHPDADHIGGAPVVITKFDIKKVFVSNYEKDNKSYLKLIQALDDKNLKYSTPRAGAKFCLGTAEITFLAPNKEYDNPNDASIALIVENGDNRFLFSGDAGEAAEKDILNNGLDISADVYQVGHHGSKYSSSKEFLDAVAPEYAVISCGEGNSYGHPHADTLNKLRSSKVKLYRTDEAGSIIAASDGKKISFSVPASETWKAGEPVGSSAAMQSKGTTNTTKSAQFNGTVDNPEAKHTGTEQPYNNESATELQDATPETNASNTTEITYVLNVKTKKFHKPSCNSLPTANRQDTSESRESVISQGYEPCKRCNP